MKTVLNIINDANEQNVVSLYEKHYGTEDGYATLNSFREFKTALNSKISEKSSLKINLTHCKDEHKEEGWVDVSATDDDDPGVNYGISFSPWGEIKTMEVIDKTNLNLDVDTQACHLYYEITYHGFEENATERFQTLLDQVKEIERRIDI